MRRAARSVTTVLAASIRSAEKVSMRPMRIFTRLYAESTISCAWSSVGVVSSVNMPISLPYSSSVRARRSAATSARVGLAGYSNVLITYSGPEHEEGSASQPTLARPSGRRRSRSASRIPPSASRVRLFVARRVVTATAAVRRGVRVVDLGVATLAVGVVVRVADGREGRVAPLGVPQARVECLGHRVLLGRGHRQRVQAIGGLVK